MMRPSEIMYFFAIPAIIKHIKIKRTVPAVPGPMSHAASVQSKALSAVTINPVSRSSKGAAFWINWKVMQHGQKKPMQHCMGSKQQEQRATFHGPGATFTSH